MDVDLNLDEECAGLILDKLISGGIPHANDLTVTYTNASRAWQCVRAPPVLLRRFSIVVG